MKKGDFDFWVKNHKSTSFMLKIRKSRSGYQKNLKIFMETSNIFFLVLVKISEFFGEIENFFRKIAI